MDALMAALVAALIVLPADRTPWLAAMLADRFGAAVVIAGGGIALAAGAAVAAYAGGWIGPQLAPNAQSLLMAVATGLAGLGALWPPRVPDRLAGWRIGGLLTSLLGIGILAAGDRTQFIILAAAAGSDTPLLAGIGGSMGAIAVLTTAALMGEAAWRALPLAPFRYVTGAGLMLFSVITGLSALRLS